MQVLLRNKWLTAAVCTGVLLLGVLDYATGYELNFFVFYFLPVSAIAWYIGLGGAVVVSLVSALVWFVANDLGGLSASHHFYAVWNTGIRLTSFLAIGFTVAHLRVLLKREQETAEALRSALSEIKVLQGVLPICAQCKKIRNDQQTWVQLEAYISQRSEARFTHGYCPECARKLLEEAGLSDRNLENGGQPE